MNNPLFFSKMSGLIMIITILVFWVLIMFSIWLIIKWLKKK